MLSGIEGSGYGLPIVRQLTSLMGGDSTLGNAPMPLWAWQRCVEAQGEYGGVDPGMGCFVLDGEGERVYVSRPMGVLAEIRLPSA